MIVLEWSIVQEWVSAVCKGIAAHTPSALAPLAAALHVGGDLIVEAEDMFLQHVTLVEGLIAKVATVLANPGCVVLVMFEVNIQLLLLNKQLSTTSNLKQKHNLLIFLDFLAKVKFSDPLENIRHLWDFNKSYLT